MGLGVGSVESQEREAPTLSSGGARGRVRHRIGRGADTFRSHHAHHTRRSTWIVGPLIAVDLFTAVTLVARGVPEPFTTGPSNSTRPQCMRMRNAEACDSIPMNETPTSFHARPAKAAEAIIAAVESDAPPLCLVPVVRHCIPRAG